MSDEENVDRSTLVRRLVRKGYELRKKEMAAERYKKGRITLSRAAEKADVTVWEMERYLTESGYKSEYSVKDLERETSKLNI